PDVDARGGRDRDPARLPAHARRPGVAARAVALPRLRPLHSGRLLQPDLRTGVAHRARPVRWQPAAAPVAVLAARARRTRTGRARRGDRLAGGPPPRGLFAGGVSA